MKMKKNHVLLTLCLCLLALTSCGKNSTTESNAVNSSSTNMSGATVAEEPQPEPTFKLVNETVTFECGSHPSTDIHDYLIADEYSNIQISDEGKGRHVYDTDTFSKFMEDANEMISV